MPDPDLLMNIVMNAMTKRYVSHVLPLKAREEIASVIVDDICGAITNCYIIDIDGRARDALKILLDLSATVLVMCDNSEDCDDEHSVHHLDFKKVCDLFEALDELPDDQPGCTMGPVAKAYWSLRDILTALNRVDEDRRKGERG